MKTPAPPPTDERIERGVIVVREGPSANCSSIGSVVDTLFIAATVGGALFVAVAAAVQREKGNVRLIGASAELNPDTTEKEEDPDAPPT